MASNSDTSSTLSFGFVEDLLIVEHELALVALLLLVKPSCAALELDSIVGVEGEVPSSQVGAEWMCSTVAELAGVGVDS